METREMDYIHYRFDARHKEKWVTVDAGTSEAPGHRHGWDRVAETLFMESKCASDPRWNPRDNRILIWPGHVPQDERTLDTLLYARYSEPGCAADVDEPTAEMLAELIEWGAIEGTETWEDGVGDVFEFTPLRRQSREFYTADEYVMGLVMYREGWLAACGRHATYYGLSDGLSAGEEEAIRDAARRSQFTKDLRAIEQAGGEIKAEYRRADHAYSVWMREHPEKDSSPEGREAWAKAFADYQGEVRRIAAKLD